MKKVFFTIILLISSISYSQDKVTVVSPDTGKELELTICHNDTRLPVFNFQENSSRYAHKDSVKFFVDILTENNIKSVKLCASANTKELIKNSKISKERGNTIAQLMIDFGYDFDNIQIDDIKDQNQLSSIENDPKNRRVEIAIVNSSLLPQTNGISKEQRKAKIAPTDNIDEARVVTKPFLFDTNSFLYCNQNYLEKFALLLEDYPDISIKLTGHCTNTEFKENPLLSKLRVQNIANLLCLMGLEKDNLKVEDLKNSKPLEATGNDSISQRVELILVD